MTCSATETNKITLAQGASRTITVVCKDEDGNLVNLDGASIYMTARHRTNDTSAVIYKRNTAAGGSDAEIEILDQSTYLGYYRIKLVPTDTRLLRVDRDYVWDSWVVLASGAYYQAIPRDSLVLLASVTRF